MKASGTTLERNCSNDSRAAFLLAQVPGVVWESWQVPDAKAGRTNYVSEQCEAIMGYSSEEWLAMPKFGLQTVHPEDREEALATTYRIFHGGIGGTYGFRAIRKSGEVIHLEARVVVVCDEKGNSLGMRGVTIEVTQQKQLEKERNELLAQLQEALKTKEVFISIASHELKTPITVLLLQIQLLLRDPTVAIAAVQTKLEPILQQCRRLSSLVDNLFGSTQVAHGKLILERTSTNFSKLIQEAVQPFSHECERKKIELHVHIQPGVWAALDSSRMEQVISNLLSNAIRYGNATPIHVRLISSREKIFLEVEDHGLGISREDQRFIFAPFRRVDHTSANGGLGLGLFIVQQIVKAHQGDVEVFSEPPKGSKFRVTIPLDQ